MTKYKMISCDLDETLLNDDKVVGKENVEAIQAAVKKGVIFVPNTGRGFKLIKKTLDELHLTNKKDEYVVSFNGSAITENYQDRVIAKTQMNFQEIDDLFRIGLKNRATMHVYTLTDIYIYNMDEDEREYVNKMGFPYHELKEPSITFLKNQPLMKILFEDKDRENLDDIRSQIPQQIIDGTTTTYSSNRYMEFNKKGVNKSKGLIELADLLHIEPKEIIAIGDNMNDFSMIQSAGMGVAVANAIPEIKDVANYVTYNNHNHGAIAEAIKKLILSDNE